MKLIISHPTGNANVRAAADGLAEFNLLSEFHTSVASFEGTWLDSIGNFKMFKELHRRRYSPVLKPKTETLPWRELGRIVASRSGFHKLTEHEKGVFCIDAVYHSLDKRVASRLKNFTKQEVNSVYAYEDGAYNSFIEAKKRGIRCVYDLPTGHWRAAQKLLQQEHERWPEWTTTMTGFKDSLIKLNRKDDELRLADLIIVASKFTAKTLQYFPDKVAPIKVVPYGFPAVGSTKEYSPIKRKLKLLFVGKLSQQKGIADLFAAADKFSSHVELTVIGRKTNNIDCSVLENNLKKHSYIPSLSNREILSIMREHDVLVFPSLFDGFGLVISEAMSQGIPVIATDRSAGPDLIEHKRNGWIIEGASTMALVEAIDNILSNRKAVAEAGKEAMEAARLRPWEQYKKDLVDALT